MKSVIVHLGALGVASVLALSTWLRDEEKDSTKRTVQVEVWGGRPESVEAVVYESATRKVHLEPKRDGAGRWFVTRYEKIDEPSPHAPPPPPPPGLSASAAPAGSAPADSAAPPPPKPAEPPKRETDVFVAVKKAEELVTKLAPLLALRSVGKIDVKQSADFGLDKPEGTLKVKIGGKEHTLTVGGPTHGGGERYAKYATSGEVFAIPNDLTQDLVYADTRLMERELHGFAQDEVEAIEIGKGGKKRAVVRVAGKRDAWADAATPAKADETIGNWLSKLERVRVVQYVEKPETLPKPEDLVVRLDYRTKSKPLGFLELYKVTGADGKPEYLAKTEYGRWYTKVLASAAEQVDRDASALLK